jgi:hypothetical protein
MVQWWHVPITNVCNFTTITKGSWTLIYMHNLGRKKIIEKFYKDTMLALPIVHSLNFMVFEVCVDAHNDYNNVVILVCVCIWKDLGNMYTSP